MGQVKKIHQIMPADGWKSRYSDYDGKGNDGLCDLVCFALCEMQDGTFEVIGMDICDGIVDFCDQTFSNFIKYEKI